MRGDLAIEDMAHVVSEVFVSYSLLILAGESAQVSDRRVEAIVETLLHGVIAPAIPAPPGGRGRPRSAASPSARVVRKKSR